MQHHIVQNRNARSLNSHGDHPFVVAVVANLVQGEPVSQPDLIRIDRLPSSD
jgi:hypothetical protein